jgi:helix-turn-helix protein
MCYNITIENKQNKLNEVDIMKEFIEVLKTNPNGAYDHICNNYYKMSKEELKDIAKELLYAVYSNVTKAEHNEILADVATELEDFYTEE